MNKCVCGQEVTMVNFYHKETCYFANLFSNIKSVAKKPFEIVKLTIRDVK